MSLRTIRLSLSVALALLLPLGPGCGGESPRSDEPTTAKDKQRRDDKQAGTRPDEPADASKWHGWRYSGDREDCFFVVGKRCFKTQEAACQAASCGKRACEIVGGGPAAVSCAKT